MAVSVLDFSAGGGQFRRGMSLLTAYRLNSGLYVECASQALDKPELDASTKCN
jgi:hypothetical protein